MTRTLVSREELEARLAAELRKDPAFDFELADEQPVGGITRLYAPDETGSNWSNTVSLGGYGYVTQVHTPIALRVLAEARAKFNVRW